MVGIGILLNKNDINRLGGEIATLRAEVRTDMAAICAEMSAKRIQFHNDIISLVNISNEMDKRVIRLEDKS